MGLFKVHRSSNALGLLVLSQPLVVDDRGQLCPQLGEYDFLLGIMRLPSPMCYVPWLQFGCHAHQHMMVSNSVITLLCCLELSGFRLLPFLHGGLCLHHRILCLNDACSESGGVCMVAIFFLATLNLHFHFKFTDLLYNHGV